MRGQEIIRTLLSSLRGRLGKRHRNEHRNNCPIVKVNNG
jgi:hypothetical protein